MRLGSLGNKGFVACFAGWIMCFGVVSTSANQKLNSMYLVNVRYGNPSAVLRSGPVSVISRVILAEKELVGLGVHLSHPFGRGRPLFMLSS